MNIASLENLEFLLSKKRNDYFAITFKNSPLEKVIKENYPKSKIIYLDLPEKNFKKIFNDEGLIFKKTNLIKQIKKYKIKGLKIDTHSSQAKEKTAKDNGFKLIITPHNLHKKLENKILFDKLLEKYKLSKPKSFNPHPNPLPKGEGIIELPIVIQKAESDGGQGTFIIKNNEQFKIFNLKFNSSFGVNLRRTGNNLKENNFLCREYISGGLTLGVGIIVSKTKMIFTALRIQAEIQGENLDHTKYMGIQWIKTSSLSKKVIKKIEENLIKIGKVLQKMNFIGIANFDIILKDEEIYFIECNPRTGGSTPHLSYNPELLHGLDFSEEMIRSTTGKELSKNIPFIPDSKYGGFSFDLDFFANYFDGVEYDIPEVGVYEIKGQISYISNKIKDFKGDSRLFFYHYHLPKTQSQYSRDNFMGFMIFNFPFLTIKGNSFDFSNKGKTAFESIRKFIENRLKI